MASGFIDLPVNADVTAGVSSVNSLTGAVTISAGSNVILTPVGNNIAISADDQDANIITYTPNDSAVWDGDPATVQEALDRMAAVVGAMTPIP